MSLIEWTATEIARAVRERAVSPVEVVEAHLARIDAWEPRIRAWTFVDREGALAEARRLDADARAGRIHGPLHGVPVGLKDIIHAAGMVTTAGAKPFAHERPTEDATVTRRLREAGAIVLGKNETCEFAFADPTETRNPWNLNHIPGGSSSGSGAAVAARMVPISLGTQTGGSTLRPAAYNGAVGLKATHGRVSAAGIHVVAWCLDHVGIIVRSVADAALTLAVLAGRDPRDAYSLTDVVGDYRAAAARPRVPRLGIPRALVEKLADTETRAHLDAVAARFRDAGAVIEDVALPASADDLAETGRVIMRVECAEYHRERFAAHAAEYSPKIREYIEAGIATKATDYVQAQQWRARYQADMRAAIGPYDGFLMPVTPAPPPADFTTTGDASFCTPWSYCGFPAMALPSGLSAGGLPLATQLIAAPLEEERLFAVAAWCERVLAFRASPPPLPPA